MYLLLLGLTLVSLSWSLRSSSMASAERACHVCALPVTECSGRAA